MPNSEIKERGAKRVLVIFLVIDIIMCVYLIGDFWGGIKYFLIVLVGMTFILFMLTIRESMDKLIEWVGGL